MTADNDSVKRDYWRMCIANKREQLKRINTPVELSKIRSPEVTRRISDLKTDIRIYLELLGLDFETQEWLEKVKEYLVYLSTWEVEDLINMIAHPSLGPAIIIEEERVERELRERDRGN